MKRHFFSKLFSINPGSTISIECFHCGDRCSEYIIMDGLHGNYIGVNHRRSIRRVYPYMIGLMAYMLIMRGMGLGIP